MRMVAVLVGLVAAAVTLTATRYRAIVVVRKKGSRRIASGGAALIGSAKDIREMGLT
jgi:hypothetical protein